MATPTVDPQIKLPQLPTRELGFRNAPAFPIDTAGMLEMPFRLSIRFKQRQQALEGLSKTYSIDGVIAALLVLAARKLARQSTVARVVRPPSGQLAGQP